MAAVAIRGTTYPIVLPKLRDPRLHLAATITSLQVLGQVAFHFKLSIAQILMCLGTVAVIEVAITAWRQHVLMWPASALLTGNGVAFVLRVPGTRHGDWWTTHGWWIFVATAGGALLSKYVIAWKGEHVFNPSNIGLVVVFLALGRTRVEPLDFWWGPMSWWMVLALAIIVTAGFAILSRLKLLRVALSFWAAFAVGIGILALGGHAMTARWHLGPIQGFQFWWILVTSPEVLVFFFFMITDPKTAPRDLRARVFYGLALGLLAAGMIAPTTTEFAAKVALLSSLAIVCAVKALPFTLTRRVVVVVAAAGAVAFAAVVALANSGVTHAGPIALPTGQLPTIRIDASPGVQTQLDLKTAEQIAYGVVRTQPAHQGDVLHVHLVPGTDQSPPTAVAQLAGVTYHLSQDESGAWAIAHASRPKPTPPVPTISAPSGSQLVDVAPSVGLDFTQDAFHFGVSNEVKAMMGGGVCWIDYNNDGRLDLFAVNSYASADLTRWKSTPTSELFENEGRSFRNVTAKTHAGLAVQGDGCAAADLDGDGRTDLVVSTTSGVDVLWNKGSSFDEQALPAPSGWYTGIAVADVNGDGRPDVFVAGYSDPNEPVPGSLAGFPTNLEGVRDLLFLNEGNDSFREVGKQAGLETSSFRHGLGAEFMDVNGDGRPDLYVANDEDPNDLYVNVPWPGGASEDPSHLGFRFEDRAGALGVADPFAGMGIAATDGRLLVTNSRGEPSAAYLDHGSTFTSNRPNIDPALGNDFAGWGAAWVDLWNSGDPDLVVAAGAIPVTSIAKSAEPMRVLAPTTRGRFASTTVFGSKAPTVNGRGLAVADAFNNGVEQIAVNTIGGKLLLLQPQGRPQGHWLDVSLSTFMPGAVVTAVLPSGRRLTQSVVAGSSYLSSEDPRVHFGLGSATHVSHLIVRSPAGTFTRLANLPADRVVSVLAPPAPKPAPPAVSSCPPAVGGPSVARTWNDIAVRVLRLGDASDAVQARDLYDLSLAISQAYDQAPPAQRDGAIAHVAYRLLVWQASFNTNLAKTFSLLEGYGRCVDSSALGDRIFTAAVNADARDGSNEALHFADPTFAAQNAPLIVAQPGSTVHDATFWQPLSYGRNRVQSFGGSQWGNVRTFAGKVRVGAPPLGDPSGKAYRDAAIAAIRATSQTSTAPPVDTSPVAWNAHLPSLGLAADVKLDLALNGALNDAAVSVYAAKRQYDAPRPISMIRYLAFNNQLPIVSGLTRRAGSVTQVLLDGTWVRGDSWTPPASTPPSPGYPSATAAYAYAASVVLKQAVMGADAGVANGTELAADVAAGKKIGLAAGRAAPAR
jgi:Na+-translocating ferredoxin:NAD+ oxidoreductase RnfD subunit